MRKGTTTSVLSGLILFSALIGGFLGPRLNATSKDTADSTDRVVKQFSEVLNLIEQNFAEPVDPDRTVYSAINGMLRTLDPHSIFFDPKRYAELREEQQGKYYGVGMTIGTIDGRTKAGPSAAARRCAGCRRHPHARTHNAALIASTKASTSLSSL